VFDGVRCGSHVGNVGDRLGESTEERWAVSPALWQCKRDGNQRGLVGYVIGNNDR
jgi:hypothetical protein